jgi:hypothetical protein
MRHKLLALCATAVLAGPFMVTAASAQSFPDGDVQQPIILNNGGTPTPTLLTNETANIGGFGVSNAPVLTVSGDLYWCADIPDTFNNNTYTNGGALASNFTANGSTITLGSNLNTISNLDKLIYNGQIYLAANANSTVSAALQIAVWAVLYDPSASGWTASALANTTGSTTRSTPLTVNDTNNSTTVADAADFLACLGSTGTLCATAWGASPDTVDLYTPAGGGQSLIALDSGVTGHQNIPEPSSLALLGAGLLGLFGVSRFRTRRAG